MTVEQLTRTVVVMDLITDTAPTHGATTVLDIDRRTVTAPAHDAATIF
jgi:hypothetical protein